MMPRTTHDTTQLGALRSGTLAHPRPTARPSRSSSTLDCLRCYCFSERRAVIRSLGKQHISFEVIHLYEEMRVPSCEVCISTQTLPFARRFGLRFGAGKLGGITSAAPALSFLQCAMIAPPGSICSSI